MHFGIPGTYNQPVWNEMGTAEREWHVQMENTLTYVSLAKLRFFARAPTPLRITSWKANIPFRIYTQVPAYASFYQKYTLAGFII